MNIPLCDKKILHKHKHYRFEWSWRDCPELFKLNVIIGVIITESNARSVVLALERQRWEEGPAFKANSMYWIPGHLGLCSKNL